MVVGQLVGTHGVRGELRLRLFNPASQALETVSEVFLSGPAIEPVRLRSARPHGGVWLVALGSVESMSDARELVGRRIALREAGLPPLREGEFYHYQLVGLEVVDEAGERLGKVAEIISAGGNDVLAVDADGRERLIPLVEEAIREVDLAAGRIVVRPLPGLFET